MVDLDKKSTFDQANINSEADNSYLTLCLLIQEEAVDDPEEGAAEPSTKSILT